MSEYNKPRSICQCGHKGDGPKSDHEDIYGKEGGGACKKCSCTRFTWKKFTKAFGATLKKKKK